MLKNHPVMTSVALAMLLVVANPAFADRERGSDQRRADFQSRNLMHSPDRGGQNVRGNDRQGMDRRFTDRRTVDNRGMDRRDLQRYYPQYRETYRPGYRVNVLPRNHVVVPYRGSRYYYDSGRWYRPFGSYFQMTLPPVGLSISLLPPYYSTVWAGGVPYYHADGVYYAWRANERNYVVVDRPAVEQSFVEQPLEAQAEAPQSERLFIYPRDGQSEEQQAEDRYNCHRWAVEQTGFDPSNPSNPTADQNVYQPDEYQRATRACLESRGYSVR